MHSRSCSKGGSFAPEPNLDVKILGFELFLQWDKSLLALGGGEYIFHEGGPNCWGPRLACDC